MIESKDILGAWTLLSYVKKCDGAVIGYPLGETPRGLILDTPDGHMGAFLQNETKPPLVAYSGKWIIQGETILHSMMFNYEAERTGETVERSARLQGGRLILSTPRKQTKDGEVWLDLIWRRPD